MIKTMKAIRKILASVKNADNQYNLINNHDKILVGVSGGKDSVVLFYALHLYKKFSGMDFIIKPVILDLGFPNFNVEPLKEFINKLGYELIVNDSTFVYQALLNNQKDNKHLPCSICSRMKKAAMNSVAKEEGFNKVAFAHHVDDSIETAFMNMFYSSRIFSFVPKMDLERSEITFIRPLIFAKEKDISRTVIEEELITLKSNCPSDGFTSRQFIKDLLNDLYTNKKEIETNLESLIHEDIYLNDKDFKINNDGLTLKIVNNKMRALDMMNIRNKVFVIEQNIPYEDEFDGSDEYTTSFIVCLNNVSIGTFRINELQKGEIKISRFCILKEYRNKGYMTEALHFIEKYLVKKINPLIITISSQINALPFYLKAGYIKTGDEFIEAGIKHQKIYKRLDKIIF